MRKYSDYSRLEIEKLCEAALKVMALLPHL